MSKHIENCELRTIGGHEQEFVNLLGKYEITWLLWDQSQFIPGGYREQDTFNYRQLQEIDENYSQIELSEKFGSELLLYKFDVGTLKQSNVSGITAPKQIARTEKWQDVDVFADTQTISIGSAPRILAPFAKTNPTDRQFEFQIKEESRKLIAELPLDHEYSFLSRPAETNLEYWASVRGDLLYVIAIANNGSEAQTIGQVPTAVPLRDFYLTINHRTFGVINPDELRAGAKFIGSDEYGGELSLDLRVYEAVRENKLEIEASELKFTNCNQFRPDAEVTRSELSNGLERIYVGETNACSISSIYKLTATEASSLVRVEFDYRTPNNSSFSFCINDSQGCISAKQVLPRAEEIENYRSTYEIGVVGLDSGITFNIDNNREELLSVDISDVSLRYYELIGTEDWVLDIDESFAREKVNSVEIVDHNLRQVEVDLQSVFFSDLDHKNELDNNINCANNEVIADVSAGDRSYLKFTVTDANVCLNADLSRARYVGSLHDSF